MENIKVNSDGQISLDVQYSNQQQSMFRSAINKVVSRVQSELNSIKTSRPSDWFSSSDTESEDDLIDAMLSQLRENLEYN